MWADELIRPLIAVESRLGILVNDVPQLSAERVNLHVEPVKPRPRSIEFFSRLLAGRQEKDQRPEDSVTVEGDVDSFLGASASVESRSGTSRIKA
jgi:hypothetical protein